MEVMFTSVTAALGFPLVLVERTRMLSEPTPSLPIPTPTMTRPPSASKRSARGLRVRSPKSSGPTESEATTDTVDSMRGQVVLADFTYARGRYVGPATIVGGTRHGSLRVLPVGWSKPIAISRDEICLGA